MGNLLIATISSVFISSSVFVFLIHKTKIKKRFIFTDNLVVIGISTAITVVVLGALTVHNRIIFVIFNFFVTVFLIAGWILLRFYRDPPRHHDANDADILAPADGFITYIRRVEKNVVPFSLKGKSISKLVELTKVDALKSPCYLVGIVMTMCDVHVNRAPTHGEVVLNKHFPGKFLSLKTGASDVENERDTIVLKNKYGYIGVIMIASKRVRGIETYVRVGQYVQTGDRIGRIKFGSQVDVVFPYDAEMKVAVGQWVYAGKTIIATMREGK